MPINEVVDLTKTSHQNMRNTTSAIREQLRLDIEELKSSEKYSAMFVALDAINDLEESLNDTTLSDEDKDLLETQLAEAKTDFDETYSTLLQEFKDEKEALFEQAKLDSEDSLEALKATYQQRVESHRDEIEAIRESIRNAGESIKNRIRDWQGNDE
jgi:ElaB/YqjD/DUF883 family membrane-anchored ribosome-binding protein